MGGHINDLHMVNKDKCGKMNCNLGGKLTPFIALFIFHFCTFSPIYFWAEASVTLDL